MKRIPLTQGKVAFVDDRLYPILARHKWYAAKARNTFYAVRSVIRRGEETRVAMHREVFRLLGRRVPATVDHKDRNGLNNQFGNLRPATVCEQNRNRGRMKNNTSGFIGVSFLPSRGKWQARVSINGRRIHVGMFDSKVMAAKARDACIKQQGDEFAVRNL